MKDDCRIYLTATLQATPPPPEGASENWYMELRNAPRVVTWVAWDGLDREVGGILALNLICRRTVRTVNLTVAGPGDSFSVQLAWYNTDVPQEWWASDIGQWEQLGQHQAAWQPYWDARKTKPTEGLRGWMQEIFPHLVADLQQLGIHVQTRVFDVERASAGPYDAEPDEPR